MSGLVMNTIQIKVLVLVFSLPIETAWNSTAIYYKLFYS